METVKSKPRLTSRKEKTTYLGIYLRHTAYKEAERARTLGSTDFLGRPPQKVAITPLPLPSLEPEGPKPQPAWYYEATFPEKRVLDRHDPRQSKWQIRGKILQQNTINIPSLFYDLKNKNIEPILRKTFRDLRFHVLDSQYIQQKGYIYTPFLCENRKVMQRLRKYAKDCQAIFSLERGGGFVADQILYKNPNIRYNFKIQKNPDLSNNFQRNFQIDMLIKTMRRIFNEDSHIKTIGICETFISGAAYKSLIKAVRKIAKEYPHIHIKCLIHRQNFYRPVSTPFLIARDAKANITSYFCSSSYILGEDVDYQLRYRGAPNSRSPLVLFDGSKEDGTLHASLLRPVETSTREELIRLIDEAK